MVSKNLKWSGCLIIIGVLITATIILSLEVIQSANSCSQCSTIDNPLLTPAKTPPTPTVNDYIHFDKFDYGHTNQTIAYFVGFKEKKADINYFLTFFYHHDSSDYPNWQLSLIKIESNERLSFSGHVTLTHDNIKVLLVDNELLKILIYPSNNTSILQLSGSGISLYFKFTGHPFWYDNGKIGGINKKERMAGFEIIGKLIGEINGRIIDGYGTLEKISFNIRIRNSPYFEDWCLFSSDEIGGLIYRQGEYRDGGLWINGEYYKPIDFLTTQLNYSYSKHYIYRMDKLISVNINGSVRYLSIKMYSLIKNDGLILSQIQIEFQGKTYQGYSIIDNALVI